MTQLSLFYVDLYVAQLKKAKLVKYKNQSNKTV